MVRAVLRAGVLAVALAPLAASADERDAVRDRFRERLSALEAAQAEIRAATEAVRVAEERRERGIEPLPGERLGMQGGGSRLAPQYFERQAGLEQEVSAARARLDRAHARRNELR